MTNIIQNEYETYFQNRKDKLREVLEAASQTEYGKKINISSYKTETYTDFCKIPFSTGIMLSEDPEFFLRGNQDDFTIRQTSGTTGQAKRIYHDPDTRIINYPESLKKIIRESNSIGLLHGKAEVMSYWLFDNTFAKFFPNVKMLIYDDMESAMRLSQEVEILYITEYVAALKRLLYSLSQMLSSGKVSKDKLRKKLVFIELTGDSMSLGEFKDVSKVVKEIFGVEPEITSAYGMTEEGGIATYTYHKDDKQIRFKVKDEKFVEVINSSTGEPVIGEKDEVVVTQLGWITGTILPRYRTGDIAILTFKDATPYLEIFGRDPSLGFLSLQQRKINVPGLINEIKAKFGIPLQSVFQVIEDEAHESSTLSVDLYSPAFVAYSLSTKVKKFLKQKIIKDNSLEWDVKRGYIKFDIRTHSEMKAELLKDWKILRKR